MVLGFENFDAGGVAGADGLLRREIQNQRGAAIRTELDEENLGDLGATAGDAADHALAQTGVEPASEEDEVGDARRLNRHDLDRAGRDRSTHRKRREREEREKAGLVEAAEHREKDSAA